MEVQLQARGRLIFFILAAFTVARAQQSLVANFHMAGVTGQADFTISAGRLNVIINLSESLGQTTVDIRPFWTVYDVEDKCSSSNLGETIQGLTGAVNIVASTPTPIQFSMSVSSLNVVEGHSIVLSSSTKTICATVHQTGTHFTAVAQFQDKVFGTVYFRQHNDSTSITRIVSDLFTKENVQDAMWKISDSYESCPPMSVMNGADVYNPGNTDGASCAENNQQMCAVGDLTKKLGNVLLGSSKGGAKEGLTDSNLPLMGNHSIGHKLLLIYLPNENSPFCAVIRVFNERAATAKFSHDGVTGSIKFTQASPFDPTETVVNLSGLSNNARGYHVHLWPTPTKMFSDQELCTDTVVSGHFNPYNKDTTSQDYPSPDASTDDMYEIGDLSAKYGTLSGAMEKSDVYTDWNLPLFGKNSIIGRSLVIHRDDIANSRWVCSNINSDHAVVTARARFAYPVIGEVVFMQEMGHPESETFIFAQLDYNNGMDGTQNHHWMVNGNRAGPDMVSANEMTRCDSTGSVFNPQNLWEQLNMSQYDEECMNGKPFACKVGDLSGKLSPIHIRKSGSDDTSRRQFFTDVNLPLSGPHSIIGKSLVIMNLEMSGILSCANIEMLHPPMLVAQLSMGGVGGIVKFNQMAGIGDQEKLVMNELTGTAQNHRIRIHELPPLDGDNPCSDLGPVYNPLSVNQETLTTDDKYEVGDLSRHGTSREWTSFNLPLSGIISIVGRSLVVLDINNSDQIVACGKINFHLPDTQSKYAESVSTFTGEVTGTIHLFQALYSDGTMSDTSILINLKNQDDSQTLNHNWHTHEKPVYGDANAQDGRCDSTGPHYDPFNTTATSDNYKTECKPSNPLRCELGDQSNKMGTYSLGMGRKVFTDIYEPLNGMFSVQGRSIVVHVPNKEAARYACADIIPVTINPVSVEFKTPATLDKQAIAEVYAEAVGARPEDVVVEHVSDADGKTTVRVHFLGFDSLRLRNEFQALVDDEKLHDKLKPYGPISAASVGALSSVLMLLVLALQLTL